jgi:acyl-coenzyme A thioesterase PaaI-like protein
MLALLNNLMVSAGQSKSSLWALNRLLLFSIPFNNPHRLQIRELSEQKAVIELPFRRSNKNHIGGMHACALATAGEYASGLLVLRRFGTVKYRVIMQELKVHYKQQGRSTATATAEWGNEMVKEELLELLDAGSPHVLPMTTRITDADGRELCEVAVRWQLKSWRAVRGASVAQAG